MARKSSDLTSSPEPGIETPQKGDAVAFVVASNAAFLEQTRAECAQMPDGSARVSTIPELSRRLSQLDRLSLAFVLLVEPTGADVDIHSLRQLKLDFPQLVLVAVLGACDQQCSLRLQSVGVHSILLPPFAGLDVSREMATALPNVPQFKRHPDLMRRGQARLDFLIPSVFAYVLGVNHEVSLLLKEFGFPPQDVRINIPLACDEAITNAIVHGNQSDPEKKVNIQIYISHSRFRMRVRDQGSGFDVATVADPREGENVLRSGGRGVFLMRNIMDTVEYKEGGRVLELEKLNTNAANNGR